MHREHAPSLPALLFFAPLLATLSLAGCPGVLEDPDRFLEDAPIVCPDIVGELFVNSCGGSICHSGDEPAAGLDLVTPGVIERLVDVMGRDCPGILVDPIDPEGSLLYDKLTVETACGSPMPLGRPMLTQAELGCVRAWIAAQGN
jgi:hypothetical protein